MEDDPNTIITTSWYIGDLDVDRKIETSEQPIAIYLAPHERSERGYVILRKIGGKNTISVTPEGAKIGQNEDIYVFGKSQTKVTVKLVWDGNQWVVEDYTA